MAVSIQFDQVGLQRVIDNFQKTGQGLGLTVQFAVWDQARLAMNDAIKFTAPRTAGPGGGSFPKQKKLGEKAIIFDLFGDNRDHRGIFGTETFYENEQGNWSKVAPGYALLRTKEGKVWLADKNLYRPSATIADMQRHHLAHRRKDGRVTTASTKDRYIGRWKASEKMFVPKPVGQAYAKFVTSYVGELKSYWLSALNRFAAKSGGVRNVPPWVERHGSNGKSVDAISSDGNGYVSMTNTAKHVSAVRADMVAFIEKKRNADIRRHMERRMERLAAQFDSLQATGRAAVA